MTTGEKILFQRKKAGLTQKALGELCKMPDSQIRQYELGMVEPKLNTIRRIATALNVSISELVSDWSNFSYEEITNDWEHNKEPFDELSTLVEKGRKETICNLLNLMNDAGQDKAVEQVEMLTKIPEYQKKEE